MTLDDVRNSLSETVAAVVEGYEWRQNPIGQSATSIFHLTANGRPPFYLKIAPRASVISLFEEKRWLDWLVNRLPVPEALLFAENETHGCLLLTEIPGVPAIDDSLKKDIPRVIERLVEGLKMIHALPVEGCPLTTQLADKIEAARERTRLGLVAEDDFDDERQGKSAAEVFREMTSCLPADRDLVFTHGDYCVPNVILKDGRLSGFVDWAEGGVADRYQDLALLTRSVGYNFGPEWQKLVFEIYGIEPEREKIRFYRLLDEFF